MAKSIEAYTIEEIAKALKLHPYTVRRLCREGKVPCYKFGGQWRLRKDDMEKWCGGKG